MKQGGECTWAGAEAEGVGGAWLSAMPASHMRFCCRRCCCVTASSTRPALMHSKIYLMSLSLSSRYCVSMTNIRIDISNATLQSLGLTNKSSARWSGVSPAALSLSWEFEHSSLRESKSAV
jgi:hypothetical protein